MLHPTTPAQAALLAYILDNPTVSYASIAERLGRSVSAICRFAQRHGIHRRERASLTLEDVAGLSE
jgi:DNA-binding MurR/RpiR family transcriptional regulator